MRSPFLLTSQLTFTLAFLGAAQMGCAIGSSKSASHQNGAAGSSSTGETAGDSNTGGQSPGGFGGQGPGGNDQGGTSSGGASQGGNQGGSAQGGSSSQGGGSSQGGNGQGGNDQGGSNQGGSAQGGGSPSDGKGVFTAPNAWTKNIGGLDKNKESDAIIGWLDQHGGWGGGQLKIDFGITVLQADNATPKLQFETTGDFYDPDCEHVPFPVPNGGSIEGEDGYECTQDGDCHLIVIHKGENKLYEMWRANMTGGKFYGGCTAVWDLGKSYPDNLRGEGCTSADAGGFPIAAMLFTAEEVKAGAIEHAIRFILPNDRIRAMTYVHPGSHSTFPTKGGANAPPYGVRLRLRKDFPLASLPSDGARVVAKAMQNYGMFLADGGTIALTGASDKYSSVAWDDVDVGQLSLSSIKVTDMEVVDMGEPILWSGSCTLN